MTYDEIYKSLVADFKARVDDATTTPEFEVQYDNLPFADSSGHPKEPPVDKNWLRVSLRLSGSEQRTIGAPGTNRVNVKGILFVECHQPVGIGTDNLWQMADIIQAAYKGPVTLVGLTSGDPIRIKQPDPRFVGRSGAFWKLNVLLPFDTDLRG